MTIRKACLDDREGILHLVASKPHAPSPTRSISSEAMRDSRVQGYSQGYASLCDLPNLELRVCLEQGRIEGFMAVLLGTCESITGEPLAVIYDYACPDSDQRFVLALLEEAEGIACRHEAESLVAEIPFGWAAQEELFDSLGYRVDLNKVVKRCGSGPILRQDFPVRRAILSDHLFVMWLNTQCARHTIPPGREHRKEEIERRYLDAYQGLDVVGDPQLAVFIAEDPEAHKPIGYIMMKTGYQDHFFGHRFGYVYDVAVDPDYWGRKVVHSLMGRADEHMQELDIPYMTGDISETNMRALKTAFQAFGFAVESRRWSKRLSHVNSL